MDKISESMSENGRDYHEPYLDAWFAVSGDTDDFIFYDGPEKTLSEK